MAEDNLKLGRAVVVDSVNSHKYTRDAWLLVAEHANSKLVEIEVICSDTNEHKERIDARKNVPSVRMHLSWEDVATRDYEPWDRKHIVVDTAGKPMKKVLMNCFLKCR